MICTPFQTAVKKIYVPIFFSSWSLSIPILKETFSSPSRKVYDNIPSSFNFPEMYKIHIFKFFLMETSEQHKGRLPTVVTFYLFLSMRFVFS